MWNGVVGSHVPFYWMLAFHETCPALIQRRIDRCDMHALALQTDWPFTTPLASLCLLRGTTSMMRATLVTTAHHTADKAVHGYLSRSRTKTGYVCLSLCEREPVSGRFSYSQNLHMCVSVSALFSRMHAWTYSLRPVESVVRETCLWGGHVFPTTLSMGRREYILLNNCVIYAVMKLETIRVSANVLWMHRLRP
jgi:hypothetical protein